MTLARFLHISVNLVSPTTPTALRKSRELLKQVRHPPRPTPQARRNKRTSGRPRGKDATARGQHLAQVRVRDASPTRSCCSVASPAARLPVAEQITTGDASGDPGDPAGTCRPPRGVAGARDGGGAPRPASRRPPPLRGRLGAAGATASPARSIRRAASPPPGPRRAPGPHRTWAGSGTRNWTGRPPPPRPRAAGSSGPPWPLRSRRRPGSGVRASARRPAARPVRGSAARRCPLGRGAAAAEAAGSGPHGAHHPPPGTAAAPLPEGAAGLSPGAPPPRTA